VPEHRFSFGVLEMLFFRPFRAWNFSWTVNPGRRSQTRFALGL